MASKNFATGLKRSALTVALGMCFAGGVQAQSTSGAIYGKADAGQTVTIVSEDVAAVTTTTIRGILPPTGSTSGSVAWLGALFAGAGALFVRLTRRRRPV